MKPAEQQFLDDLDKELWTAANKLLPMLDAAVYKHVLCREQEMKAQVARKRAAARRCLPTAATSSTGPNSLSKRARPIRNCCCAVTSARPSP